MLESFILPGISLGLSAASTPGPLQAYLLNITLRYNWRRGLWVIISPLIIDIPVIIVIVFILGQLPEAILDGIRLAGGAFLLWMAWGVYQQIQSGALFAAENPAPNADETAIMPDHETNITILGKAMLVNALSPGPYIFWATVNGPLLIAGLQQSIWHGLAFVGAFYGTFLGGMVVLALVFDRVGKVNPLVTQLLMRVAMVVLIVIGTLLIAQAFNLVSLHETVMRVLAIVFLAWILWPLVRRRQGAA